MRTITINSLPSTIEEFVALRDKIATTPEGGATIFLLALKIYVQNEKLGEQCFVVAADRQALQTGNVYKGYKLSNSSLSLIKSQLSKNPKIPDSYIQGASPENNYAVNLPYVYTFSENKYSGNEADGRIKLFVKSYGADSDRPITVVRNKRGIWKANNWSSVIVGIKKTQIDDDI